MELIAKMEGLDRGPYGGAIGWLGLDKDSVNLDLGITIRSLWTRDGQVHFRAGAGIVYDSVPENEWRDCLNKAAAIMTALAGAEREVQ
ncbi:MAG: chorismate-binding protein, partial [Deltaproteobacteria bacterium]|jgi:anthranilate synthase component 1|nr:chorismate-binding protein [Deltaproteobacteria bacterium]